MEYCLKWKMFKIMREITSISNTFLNLNGNKFPKKELTNPNIIKELKNWEKEHLEQFLKFLFKINLIKN